MDTKQLMQFEKRICFWPVFDVQQLSGAMKEMRLIYVVVALLSFTKGQYTGTFDNKAFLFLFNKEIVAFEFI